MATVRGEGSVMQLERDKPRSKCRRWKIQVPIGRNLATGKYERVIRNFEGTYSEAVKAKRALISEIEAGRARKVGKAGFAEYADGWLELRRRSVSRGTWQKNTNQLKAALMHLRDAKMGEVAPQDLERMYAALMDGESPSGRRLSGAYVAGIASTLHTMFRDALREGVVISNPCDLAKPPKVDTPEKQALDVDQMSDLVGNLDPTDPSQMALLLCVKAGLRRGEAYGLSWGDVDGDVLHVRHSYDGTDLRPTKTRKGTRDLPITESLAADLRVRRAKVESDLAEAGALAGTPMRITPDTPVICNVLGEREKPHSATRWLSRNAERLGCPGVTVHQLRHSYLSELARRRVPARVLQEIAGHESYNTTMKIYVHVNMDDKREAVSKADW